MAGGTNTRGPLPKGPGAPVSSDSPGFRWKPADKSWHPVPKGIYMSLKNLKHAGEFQESDMWFARSICEKHTIALSNPYEPNAALFKSVTEDWAALGVTLGSRKRFALEEREVEKEDNRDDVMKQLAASMRSGVPMKKEEGDRG